MFNVYDRYMMRQLLVATLVVASSLSIIILLTQSLRLIELVLESNASSSAFMAMMTLSLPRFVEAVLPASVLISTLFVLHRLTMDSEMIVLRASGASPMRLARPIFTFGMFLVAALLVISLWISPKGISHMHTIQQEIRAQYSHLLFREGIFNSVGKNLTAYVRARAPDGQLTGLMVHDTRGPNPITVIARSGHIVSEDDSQKIIVYDGSRQEDDKKTGKFSRLDFKQYTLDIPASSEEKSRRWREPDERTISELTDIDLQTNETPAVRQEFNAEIHRRYTTPILMLAFALMATVFILQGSFTRGGQMPVIIAASLMAVVLQGVYLVSYNIAKKDMSGCWLLYLVSLTPVLVSIFFLMPSGERLISKVTRSWQRIRNSGQGR